ncbi:MAG: hypothetical protein ACTHQM_24370 [Thermoanaerobaculia bacterium]
MHARLLAFVLLVAALPAHALTLDELRRTLASFDGQTPFRVKIDSTHRRGEGKEKKDSRGTAIAEDDGTSIRIVHDKKELRLQLAKPSSDRTDHSVPAAEAFELMNFAPSLLRTLEGATLKKVSPAVLDGNAVTLVEIVPVREKDEDGDKWIKSYSDTLLLWLGPGNVPVAAERTMKMKARIVVIGVEFAKKEKWRFLRAGERLVVAARSLESSGSGLGRSETEFKTAMVTVLK